MKLTKQQLKQIIKEELQTIMHEQMGQSLYQNVISNIDKDIYSGSIEKRYQEAGRSVFEVRKYVKLLKVIEDSGYDEDMLSDPDMAAGLWMDIFNTVEDLSWADGREKFPIKFTKSEIEAMCTIESDVWKEVVEENGVDNPE